MRSKKKTKYEVWVTKGKYIQEEKCHKGTLTFEAAKEKASKVNGFKKLVKDNDPKSEVAFWIEDENNMFVGSINEK